VILKVATTPELHVEALRAAARLRAAGHAVEVVASAGARLGHPHDVPVDSTRDGDVDLAIVPLHRVRGHEGIAAILHRDEPEDVLVARGPGARTLRGLAPGRRVGVAGARRRALLRAHRPDLEPLSLENGQSPPEAFSAGLVDAALMGADEARHARLEPYVAEFQDPKSWLPSPLQGAVAVIAEGGAAELARTALDHEPTRLAAACEAGLATRLDAWHAALGAVAMTSGPTMRLWAMLVSPDGRKVVRGDLTGRAEEPEALAERMAELLWARGAQAVLGS
jgi:hydroxymethylbilane synthase